MEIKLHIDNRGYRSKPDSKDIAGLKKRLQNNSKPISITVEELLHKLESGHSISPAVMSGMTAASWEEQQLFMVDIDNANDDIPVLTPKQAIDLCSQNDLPLAFYYYTFSHIKNKPKFRLAFISEKVVTDPRDRKSMMDALTSFFPQCDKACINADRIFLGTNKKVTLLDENARISIKRVSAVYSPPSPNPSDSKQYSDAKRASPELDELIRDFDFRKYLIERNGDYSENDKTIKFKHCEVCGHNNDLVYYKETNSFYCFSANGDIGGSIIDYLIATEGITMAQAIDKLKNELCDNEWQVPVPLEEYKLPPFPIESLPTPLRKYVSAVANNTSTPVDMAAVSALAIASLAVQKKFVIQGKPGWVEPLNIYILIIANSGERKSAIIRAMTKPITQYEAEVNERRKPEIAKQEAQLSFLKKQIDKLEKQNKEQEAQKLMLKCRELENKRMKLLRLTVDDVTPEALTSVLADNYGAATILSTEGGIFDILNGRYSDSISIDTVLKAHSGDSIRVDRKGRERETIEHPALTILISAQENVLEGLINNEAFKSRGLTARWLYCKPESMMGTRPFATPAIPVQLENAYNKLVSDMLRIPLDKDKASTIKLDIESTNSIESFHNWLEPQLREDLKHLGGWAGKLIGATLRIVGILHCIENKKSSADVLVSKTTMERAVSIAKYFLEHAKYVHSIMGTDKTLKGAKDILRKLEQQTKGELTKYEIFRLCRSFQNVNEILPSLDLLIDYGYMKGRPNNERTGGRPKGKTYILNPLHFKV